MLNVVPDGTDSKKGVSKVKKVLSVAFWFQISKLFKLPFVYKFNVNRNNK